MTIICCSFSWLKDGVKLDINTKPNIKLQLPGTIIIQPASLFDTGYYQCIAENQYGKAMSDVIFLERAGESFI